MIRAVFRRDARGLRSVEVSGHAGQAAFGSDVVCAAVSSAVMLTCNAVTEIAKAPAGLVAEDNRIRLTLPPGCRAAQPFMEALLLHLRALREAHGSYIRLSVVNSGTDHVIVRRK